MATIATATNHLRHVRKTVTFDGGAGSGAVGTVALLTITGRVIVTRYAVFDTVTLEGATATISLGPVSQVSDLISVTTATTITANSWWSPGGVAAGGNTVGPSAVDATVANGYSLSENLQYNVLTQAITAGTLVLDVWYLPVTDNGALAGDDIDSGYLQADTDLIVAALQDEVRYGTAQAGASATITLDAGASAVDDFYNGCAIMLISGTGAASVAAGDRVRVVTDYVGSTKVATVAAWATAPDATTEFIVIGKN